MWLYLFHLIINLDNSSVVKMPKSVLKNSTKVQQTATEKMNIIPESSSSMQK
jgi:hypothetical protein